MPDILGMKLDEAKALLETEGQTFRIIETKPTKPIDDSGTLRIIKVSMVNDKEVSIVVCKI